MFFSISVKLELLIIIIKNNIYIIIFIIKLKYKAYNIQIKKLIYILSKIILYIIKNYFLLINSTNFTEIINFNIIYKIKILKYIYKSL